MEELKRDGLDFSYLVDDTESLQGKVIEGLKVISRKEADEKGIKNMIVITMRHNLVSDSYKGKEVNLLPFVWYDVCKHYDEWRDVRDHYFDDEKSKLVFNVAMYAKLTNWLECKLYKLVAEENQYFALPDFKFLYDEHIIDCGAYFGDNLEQFVNHSVTSIKKYYAFEPNPIAYDVLKKRITRIESEWGMKTDTITVEKAGIGAMDSCVSGRTDRGDAPSAFSLKESGGNGDSNIIVRSIDSYFSDKKVTLIKADIEGLEYELIKGAAKTISTQKPKIAICAYHMTYDLWRLAIELKKLNPNYKFALRHHSTRHNETVLYCWQEE